MAGKLIVEGKLHRLYEMQNRVKSTGGFFLNRMISNIYTPRDILPRKIEDVEFTREVNPDTELINAGLCSDDRLKFATVDYQVKNCFIRPEAAALGGLIKRYQHAEGKPPQNPFAFTRGVDRLTNIMTGLKTIGAWRPWRLSTEITNTKCCPSCHRSRPNKYRWKHGICNECWDQPEPITRLGSWYLIGGECGTGLPGLIRMNFNFF